MKSTKPLYSPPNILVLCIVTLMSPLKLLVFCQPEFSKWKLAHLSKSSSGDNFISSFRVSPSRSKAASAWRQKPSVSIQCDSSHARVTVVVVVVIFIIIIITIILPFTLREAQAGLHLPLLGLEACSIVTGFTLDTHNFVAREMSYLVQCFLCEHENLCSIPSTYSTKPGVVVKACNLRAGEVEIGGSLGLSS